mgnify:CR=1 FL=1
MRVVIDFMFVSTIVGLVVMAGVGIGAVVGAFTAPRQTVRVSSGDVLPAKNYTMVLQDDEQTIVSIDSKGEVTFGEGVTLTEASRAFWKAMGKDHCEVCYAVEVQQ